MKCTIEAPDRDEAVNQIRSTVKRHGYDWTEVDAILPSGEVVRWIPMVEAMRRIAAGNKTVHAHFYGAH